MFLFINFYYFNLLIYSFVYYIHINTYLVLFPTLKTKEPIYISNLDNSNYVTTIL